MVIDGISFKELFCKNDDCRMLLGYEKVVIGILVFDCRRCGTRSIFRVKYSEMKEQFDKLREKKEPEGGEINNGSST